MADNYSSLDVGRFLLALRTERTEIENAISFLERSAPPSPHTSQADARSTSDLRRLKRAMKQKSINPA